MTTEELIQQAEALARRPTPDEARRIRTSAGISQAQLADALRVPRSTVVRWEAGDRVPRGRVLVAYVDLLERLRDALRVDVTAG